MSADTVVPGSASGGMDGIAVKPLTVDFHEGGFQSKLNQENGLGFWFQLSDQQRQQAGSPWGPANVQALNRYSYVQNNPMRWTDPSGHYTKRGDEEYGYESVCGTDGQQECTGSNDFVDPITGKTYVRVWVNGHYKIVAEDSVEFGQFKDQLDDYLNVKSEHEAALLEFGMALAATIVACGFGGPGACAAAFAVYTVTAANLAHKELKLWEAEDRLRKSFKAL